MTSRLLLALLVAFSTLVVAAQTARKTELPQYENAEAYRVYEALLSTQFTSLTSFGKPLLIAAETNSSSSCLVPEGQSKRILASALADHGRQNMRTYLLQRKFAGLKSYELLNSDQRGKRFKRPADGYFVELSAVGFNSAKTIAVVSAGVSCAGLCRSYTDYVFQKKGGRWTPLTWEGTRCMVAS